MFGAIKQPNGKYMITEVYERHRGRWQSKTFSIKDKLKALGGKWNPDTRHWENIDEVNLKEIPAEKRLKIRIAPWSCNDKPSDSYAYPCDIEDGYVFRLNMGDDHERVKIEEIYGEG